MKENTSDQQFRDEMLDFKAQMLRFVEIAGQKFDGLASDIRGNSFHIDKIEQKLDNLDEKVSLMSTKIDQVTEQIVSHEKRLRAIEGARPTVN